MLCARWKRSGSSMHSSRRGRREAADAFPSQPPPVDPPLLSQPTFAARSAVCVVRSAAALDCDREANGTARCRPFAPRAASAPPPLSPLSHSPHPSHSLLSSSRSFPLSLRTMLFLCCCSDSAVLSSESLRPRPRRALSAAPPTAAAVLASDAAPLLASDAIDSDSRSSMAVQRNLGGQQSTMRVASPSLLLPAAPPIAERIACEIDVPLLHSLIRRGDASAIRALLSALPLERACDLFVCDRRVGVSALRLSSSLHALRPRDAAAADIDCALQAAAIIWRRHTRPKLQRALARTPLTLNAGQIVLSFVDGAE